jgi:hypothetical protein
MNPFLLFESDQVGWRCAQKRNNDYLSPKHEVEKSKNLLEDKFGFDLEERSDCVCVEGYRLKRDSKNGCGFHSLPG